MDDKSLATAALEARTLAYAPYSGFRVGAALLCADGTVVTAANLENASFGLSVCAERNAVARAIQTGHRQWTRLAIATDAAEQIPPCGACLQVLREFADDLDILLVNREGDFSRVKLSELLPHPFTDFPRPTPTGDRQ
jgi:cytidine deaminase